MGFVDDKTVYVKQEDGTPFDEDLKGFSEQINRENPFAQEDYGLVVKTFEVECSRWAEEDYATAYHYKDVYGLRQFSYRVRQQMQHYPGMHQTAAPPVQDPAYTTAKKMEEDRLTYWNRALDGTDSFMSGLESRQRDIDYNKIFGDVSGKTRAENVGKMLTECIPCFDRLLDGADLLPDGDLLEMHLLNIKLRTDILDRLKTLLEDPGYYLDICELLKLLSHLCPQDLLALSILFSQYLAKLNLDIKFNLDIIVELLGPILSPFLDGIASWLDKWIQMILAPILCVVDHINETILLAQQAKIPMSQATVTADYDVGTALPLHENAETQAGAGLDTKHKTAWADAQTEEFQTPDAEKYNPSRPELPDEEAELSGEEIGDEWGKFAEAYGVDNDLVSTQEERAEREKRWQDLREEERRRRMRIPPPVQRVDAKGRRWMKEDTPRIMQRKAVGERPTPEEQQFPKPASEYYFDPSPIVNSLVQIRNVTQASVAYIQDWFEYVTQMIHDLIGTDFGWMSKKTDTTMLKSRLVQLIYIIKALIEAISRNGLECGVNSNFDQSQMKFILEEVLNSSSPTYQFEVAEDGSITLNPPDGPLKAEAIDRGQGYRSKEDKAEAATRPTDEKNKQKSISSGIIIKNCLKNVSEDELIKTRQWIADFEKRSTHA